MEITITLTEFNRLIVYNILQNVWNVLYYYHFTTNLLIIVVSLTKTN